MDFQGEAMAEKEMEGEKGCIGPVGERGPRQYSGNSKEKQIEEHLISLMNLLGVSIGNFVTKEIDTNSNSDITKLDQRIVNICKSSEHALSLSLKGYSVTADGKLYSGWWDNMCPSKIEEIFMRDTCCPWLKDNVIGAKFLYVLTAFWGCDHTDYYVFEYENGVFKFTSNTFAVT